MQTGELTTISARDVFPHELDFSRWIKNNVDHLNRLVNFKIQTETLAQEVTNGSIRVDLLAKALWPDDPTPCPVIIENQFGTTDSGHLSGVLEYTAAFEARGAIWIAEHAKQEHVDVTTWLNAKSELDAYLIVVEAIRIDDSRPFPILRTIAGPPAASRSGGRSADPVKRERVRQWWERVLPKIGTVHAAWTSWCERRPPSEQYGGPTIPGGTIGWFVSTKEHNTTCGISINDSRDYEQLEKHAEDIDQACDDAPNWGKEKRFLTWHNPLPGGFDDDPETQGKAIAKLVDMMRSIISVSERITTRLPALDKNKEIETRSSNA